ncbi:MAG: hypothetical protein M0Z39_03390 [Actinomycetota bacterium]|nr:hypothetical protein [Actinomycetota bacterium]
MASEPESTRPLRDFATLLRSSTVRWVVAEGFIGRLREGGIGLAIVLLVRHATGTFGPAGLAVAAFALSTAFTRREHGRFMDAFGVRRVMGLTAAANTVAMLGLALLSHEPDQSVSLIVMAGLCGVTLPAFTPAIRSFWTTTRKEMARSALVVDAFLYELSMTAAPGLVGLVAVVAGPSITVIVLAALGCAGSMGFALTAGSCRNGRSFTWRHHPPEHRLARGIWVLVVLAGVLGGAEGALTVALPAYAVGIGGASRAGVLLSAIAAGSLLGGLLYSGLRLRGNVKVELVASSSVFAAGLVMLVVLRGGFALTAILCVIAGLGLAPIVAVILACVSKLAPAERATEAFALVGAAWPLGVGLAEAVVGLLVTSVGVGPGLLVAPVCAGAAVVGAVLFRRVLFDGMGSKT